MQAQGSIINKEVILANENTPINTDGNAYKELSIYIDRVGDSSKAKLMVEAQYRVTEFTDVIKYSKSTNQVTCNDYWTAYKIKYDYAIMFKDQMKDYFDEITEAQYRSTARPHFEKINNSDTKQKERLRKYNILKPDEK